MSSPEALPPEEPQRRQSRMRKWWQAFGASQARSQGLSASPVQSPKPDFNPVPSKVDQAYARHLAAKQQPLAIGAEDTSWWSDRVAYLQIQDRQIERYCGDLVAARVIEDVIAQFPPERP